MEAVSSLELGGVIYPRCDQYGASAGMAGAGAGNHAALAPGQHVPPGEAPVCWKDTSALCMHPAPNSDQRTFHSTWVSQSRLAMYYVSV